MVESELRKKLARDTGESHSSESVGRSGGGLFRSKVRVACRQPEAAIEAVAVCFEGHCPVVESAWISCACQVQERVARRNAQEPQRTAGAEKNDRNEDDFGNECRVGNAHYVGRPREADEQVIDGQIFSAIAHRQLPAADLT